MAFHDYPLQLIKPNFDSPLTDLVLELEHLRRKQLKGSTHPYLFRQLKRMFHMLESIGSARIEGNNTTVAQYVETKIDQQPHENEGIREILNIEEAMAFVDEHVPERGISSSFIKELHRLIVKDLTTPPYGEGDRSPGNWRNWAVQIAGAQHTTPRRL